MKSIFSILGCLSALALSMSSTHGAKLNVVATLPDYGAIAQVIGGDLVKVTSMTKGTEDPHFVDARPSFVTLLNRADVLLEGGLDLEIAWLPMLVNSARNARIAAEGRGRVILSQGIRVLEVPSGPVDRSMGDVHANGNPHYWLDPANGKMMAATIAAAFVRLDPGNAASYQVNLATFNQRLEQKLAEWTKLLERFRGTKVVTYHRSFNYFLERFGLELVDTVEPKPGIEPSPTHINALIPRAKTHDVKLVIIEPNRPHRTPAYVAEAIGAKLLTLPQMVGGNEKVKDYFGLFDYAVSEIVEALEE